jgi:acyl carrier protein
MLTVEQRVKTAISDMLMKPGYLIENSHNLREDLDIDSVDAACILMDLECEFDRCVRDEDAEKWETVQDVVNFFTPPVDLVCVHAEGPQ